MFRYGPMVLIIIALCSIVISEGQKTTMKFRKLTAEEERVIVHKGTEAPFSGEYYNHFARGTYSCRRCGAPLYKSEDKFDAGCGWPSFDDEIAGAVRRQTDADGMRTEILCSNCGAHLGHVFAGEGFTEKNTRHCVNSISMLFIPDKEEQVVEKAIFAGGCFWGMEHCFQKLEGVLSTRVGYTGGKVKKPTYVEVCNGNTGHAEALEVTYDPAKIDYETLTRYFFEIHDPTQVNRQGPDIGEQYRSAIYYLNDEQKAVAEKLITILEGKGYAIATQLFEAGEFWEAEDYHQDYYFKNGQLPYCHVYTKRF